MGDERPRKSWRELDRQRDQSQQRRDGPGGGPSAPARSRSQKSYRAKLDRLFDSGKIGQLLDEEPVPEGAAERLKRLKALKLAEGRDAVTKAVDAYRKDYELPHDDLEVLAKLLEHRDAALQLAGMKSLRQALQTETPRRTRGIIGQLKLIRDMADDDEARELASTLIEQLGG